MINRPIEVECMYANVVWGGGSVDWWMTFLTEGAGSPKGKGQIFWWGNWTVQCRPNVYIGRMWHCAVDVAYPRLSDWTRLQWALHRLVAHAADETFIVCLFAAKL